MVKINPYGLLGFLIILVATIVTWGVIALLLFNLLIPPQELSIEEEDSKLSEGRISTEAAETSISYMLSDDELILWGLVREYRHSKKLTAINLDLRICELAQIRSKEVLVKWGHEGEHGINGHGFQEAEVRASFCKDCVYLAEDLAMVNLPLGGILQGWLNSPPHRKLIEDPGVNVGCASISYAEDGTMYSVLLLGEKR